MKSIMTAVLAISTMVSHSSAAERVAPSTSSSSSSFVTSSEGVAFVAKAKQLQAFDADGKVVWTAPLAAGAVRLIVSANDVITVTEASHPTLTVVATLTAFSKESGKVKWTSKIPSHITELTPFSGGTYAVIVCPAPAGGTATPWLGAFANDGTLIWTTAL